MVHNGVCHKGQAFLKKERFRQSDRDLARVHRTSNEVLAEVSGVHSHNGLFIYLKRFIFFYWFTFIFNNSKSYRKNIYNKNILIILLVIIINDK